MARARLQVSLPVLQLVLAIFHPTITLSNERWAAHASPHPCPVTTLSLPHSDPQAELPDVIRELTSGNSPTIQRDVIRRVFTRDASFNHPLCRVVSSPDSRDRQLLRIYQVSGRAR